MASVSVSPETFGMVAFDASAIAAVAERLCDQIGLPADLPVSIEVDETVPLSGTRMRSVDPVRLEVQGGAFEDPKRIRQFSELEAVRGLGRLLFQVVDRRDAAFGDPPPADELPLPLRVAWDSYQAGRVARLGYPGQQQRWRYAFRTRHGFSDEADRAFEALWSGEGLTWADIERLSAGASVQAA